MNSRERILKAFNHEEPDRVPTFCQVVMPIFKKRLENLWGKDFKKDRKLIFFDKDHNYAKKLGFDCEWSSQGYSINIPDDYMKENPLPTLDNPEFSIDIDGRIFKKGSLEITNEWYVKNYITTEEKADYFYDTYWNVEWETYPNTIKMLNRKLRRFPTDDFVPTCALHAILEPIWEGLGFALLAKLLRKKKDKIKRYIDLRTKIAIEHAKLMVESDYEIFHLCDDTAFKNNTMIDPAIHRELVVPAYKKIIQEIKKKGKIAFFHSDGFTEPYFDGLIEAGFDGIESLEPMAGMDLKY
ncbi:MAG: hypothetical protein GY870_21420, partial [archaeon]|nr:hypothetical protein [archaeon]